MNQSAALLNLLFNRFPGLYAELTFIDPKGVHGLQPDIFTDSYRIGHQRINWERIDTLNQHGYSVYYAITPKQRPTSAYHRSRERDAAFCQALWVDIDLHDGHYQTLAQAYGALCWFNPVPNVIISTGGGLHGIWLIEPVPVTAKTLPLLKAHLRGLALALRADTSVAELARVLRLPGTTNTKPERVGALCQLMDGALLRTVYALEQFPREELPRHEDRPRRDVPPDSMPHYVRWYLTATHSEGGRNNALNWCAWKLYGDGFSQADAAALLRERALASGLDAREVERTLASPWNSRKSG